MVFKDAYSKPADDDWKWFENYNYNFDVIIDEMDRGRAPFRSLLDLLDCKSYRVQVKGSSREYVGMYQIFTSNTDLRGLYDYSEDYKLIMGYDGQQKVNRKEYAAIYRRFQYIIECRKFRDDDRRPCLDVCVCCQVRRIFLKGSREKFNNLEFDIKFNLGVTYDQASKIIEKLNCDGELLKYGNRLIWRRQFEDENGYVVTEPTIRNGFESDVITFPDIINDINENYAFNDPDESWKFKKSEKRSIEDFDNVRMNKKQRTEVDTDKEQ
ncbi:MAG TPA: hypothetical protein VIY08_11555, partial [Candidatus Nitrosocosmicus sp.]